MYLGDNVTTCSQYLFLIAPSVFSNFYSKAHFRAELLLELTLFKSFYEWAEASLMMSNKNGQSTETGNKGHTRRR
jgi:hypothetical protein